MFSIQADIFHRVLCNPDNWKAVPATYALGHGRHMPILILFQPTEGTGIVKVPFMVLAELAGADNYYFVDYNSVPDSAPFCADPDVCLSVICSHLENDMEFGDTMHDAYDHAAYEEE